MSSEVLYTAIILAVVLERCAEVVVSQRNAAWALSRGGVESGRGHYPVMVVLHAGLLVGCLVEVHAAGRSFEPLLGWSMLALVVVCQAVRWWCITVLGRQWNTRVIVVPDLPLVQAGPYRVLPHPNYLVVVLEGMALPLIHGAWITAVVFTVANAALLRVRIRVEDRALSAATVS
ncbi:isoprenylcysteine carboxyl methyltransferase family protein [Nocardioides sp. zg-DK7169]|uniref:isoprenylcysteine carboxyl methyltransferase family protein n=1 Tax=Nocardioides sp. zg-DK7169 TaxID=2736600 RepID=UPI001551773B|nr:isoprenylcysteine carboxyl methyltransferase family protein [Nocardioides sp. zg-DK7169]NPC96818.1 isoprenylcysteine carboxyl methyltransferase family protein [Nocardioides sp. zg-DK7169]